MLKKILNNKTFKISYAIVRTLFIVMMVLYVGVIALQKASNNSSIIGFRFFTIASNSMFPDYKIGDVIVVKDSTEFNVGDDITYLGKKEDFKDKIITHRIIKKDNNTFVTKGINNDVEDPTIDYSQIYGKVVYKPIIISFVSTILKNKFGFFFLVFTPLVLVMFLEVADAVMKKDEA